MLYVGAAITLINCTQGGGLITLIKIYSNMNNLDLEY